MNKFSWKVAGVAGFFILAALGSGREPSAEAVAYSRAVNVCIARLDSASCGTWESRYKRMRPDAHRGEARAAFIAQFSGNMSTIDQFYTTGPGAR